MQNTILEHVTPYFIDCLYVQVKSVDGTEVLPITAIQRKDGTDIIQISNTDYYPDSDENEFSIKPILYPMNLKTPIAVDGKEIIPIVELAKISKPDYNWYMASDLSCRSLPHDRWRFAYRKDLKSFVTVYHGLTITDQITENQLALFKKLYEWKMDVDGLIGQGLAIDAGTLDVNPYNS